MLACSKEEYQRLKDAGSSTLTNEDKVEIGRRWNNLPKEEKKKFEDEAASANELLSSLKALDSRPRKRRRKIQTRIALKQITEIVSKFSEEQRTAVKAIGLGGILNLSCTKLNHGICECVEGFREMCTDLGVTKGFVEIKGLQVYLLKSTVANEEFKRKFALYILGSYHLTRVATGFASRLTSASK
ncbi:hypothetical protein Vadar_000235 [Vaccinium darrowii]|uniref:Uncharacterized protein n=1 Tax=Vaccinium darrowii TaxID=229202 RepID=A0ACB7XMF6_9ERIC|nr:hypothetical protein Vadar_000235 [Vaccinium darrowii]